MTKLASLKNELEKYNGVARMKQCWITWDVLPPGRRLKVHPDDMYPKGVRAGGITERRFVCEGTTVFDGDPDPKAMSYFYLPDDEEGISFREALKTMGNELIGKEAMDAYGGYIGFAKLYDLIASIPFHIHAREEQAKAVGVNPKPESYYFPVEYNMIRYHSDHTWFGFTEDTTKDDIIKCIRNYGSGHNDILNFSKAYKIELGTGWYVPAGILHAPASVVTYEPQLLSDTLTFYQDNVDHIYGMNPDINEASIPEGYNGDKAEYILDMLDWEANIDPDFRKKYFHKPIPVDDVNAMADAGYYEEWISYGSPDFSAKRLVIEPGKSVTIKDSVSYGYVSTQGYGTINGMKINTPTIIRTDNVQEDEGFVTIEAAQNGVKIVNESEFNPLVLLKHFNAGNPNAAKFL